MMSKKYPAISMVSKRSKNTQSKCVCGEIAKFKTEIQFSYFRGDDDVIWSCEEHKIDLDTLICGSVQEVIND